MRVREMGYTDYEFRANEEHELLAKLQRADFNQHEALIMCATLTKPEIAPELYYSIVSGASYEKLDTIRYIPIAKGDFYAYRRSTLAKIRDLLDAKAEREADHAGT